MKKYKLKTECKKYFDNIGLMPKTLAQWKDLSVSKEALEEVEEKIKLYFAGSALLKVRTSSSSNSSSIKTEKWSEQERADIEKFLNLGGWNGLCKVWISYCKNEKQISFIQYLEDYLKEKGCDK